MSNSRYNLIVVLGPTACGKTRFAAELANLIHGEIISADSRQVYRRMNLGTGKDYKDYQVDDKIIPFHLIDILEPGEKYNLFEFQKDFLNVYKDIHQRKKKVSACGGTGLYIDAVTSAYKLIPVPVNDKLRSELEQKSLEDLTDMLATYKKLHNQTDVDTKKRAIRAIEIEEYYKSHPANVNDFPKLKSVLLGIRYDREEVKNRITGRLYARLKEGMIEEVDNLLKEDLSAEDLMYYGLEYKYITMYLTNRLTYDDMVEKLNIAIHQFAKRQMTWFRKMEREGAKIHWIEGNKSMEEKLDEAMNLINI